MNRTDLARSLAMNSWLDRASAEKVLKSVEECIAAALANGDSVELYGFGNFSTHTVPARKGRNPHNGDPVNIPAKARVTFHPSAPLKRRVQSLVRTVPRTAE